MKKKFLCLCLCISLAGIFSGCDDDDLFKIQGKVYDNPSATDDFVTTDEYGYQTYSRKISIDEKPEITNISVTAE